MHTLGKEVLDGGVELLSVGHCQMDSHRLQSDLQALRDCSLDAAGEVVQVAVDQPQQAPLLVIRRDLQIVPEIADLLSQALQNQSQQLGVSGASFPSH